MDSFIGNTEFIKMKRNYDTSLLERDSSTIFGNTRHNLLPDFDFEETPAKSAKLTESTSMKRSYSSFATPGSAEITALKKQLTAREADIISLKAKITQFENRLSSMEVAARQARIEHDKEVAKLKTEKDRETTKSAELRSKLQYVMEREKTAREEVQKLEDTLQKEKLEKDRKLLEVQREKLDTADHAQQAKASWMEKEHELRAEIVSQMREISDLHSKWEETQAQLELKRKQQIDLTKLEQEIEELKAQLKIELNKNKDLEHKFSEYEDNLLTTKALKNDLDLVPAMKSELEKLRNDNEQLRHNEQNTFLLEEELRSVKRKLEMAEAAQQRIAELEVENEELQGRLHRWEASDTSGSRRPQSPSSLSRRIQELETSQASLMLKHGEMESNLNITKRKLEQSQAENHKLLAELNAEKNNITQLNELVKRLRRKQLLVSKERDSYKSLLDSYESEVTVNFDAERRAQTQRLEGILQGYKQQAAECETEMTSMTDRLTDLQSKYEQAQLQLQALTTGDQQKSRSEDEDSIRQLRERVAELENNLLKIEEEKDILEARIEQRHLQGDYDPSKTKIVHLTMNPCFIAQQARQEELERLKEENEQLKKRNEVLEEHGGRVDDVTLQVQEKLQQPSPSKAIEDMKAKLTREEMRNKRLMEVFKKTSQEFRDICYQLTGYKIDIPCSNQYRLTSMYAESPRDFLLFQQNEKGEIQLLQTDFSLTLQEAMEMYLQRQNSIPMFLSHITMDLFSRQTINLG